MSLSSFCGPRQYSGTSVFSLRDEALEKMRTFLGGQFQDFSVQGFKLGAHAGRQDGCVQQTMACHIRRFAASLRSVRVNGWLEDALHAPSRKSFLASNTFFNFPNPVWPSLSLFHPFILFGLHNKQPALAFFRLPRLWFMISLPRGDRPVIDIEPAIASIANLTLMG